MLEFLLQVATTGGLYTCLAAGRLMFVQIKIEVNVIVVTAHFLPDKEGGLLRFLF